MRTVVAAFLFPAVTAAAASAAPLNITSIVESWEDRSPAANVTALATQEDQGTDAIRWGGDAGGISGVPVTIPDLFSFSHNDGVTIMSNSFAAEGSTNAAVLYAIVTSQPMSAIPEPATLLMFGAGLGAIAFRLRSRRRRS